MIYYIHGYLSSPDGSKATILKEKLGVIPIKYRDCQPEDLVISDCLDKIQNTIGSDPNPILIGSSLGGLLAVLTAFQQQVSLLILLNPAVIPPDIDINSISDMPLKILADMKDTRLFIEKVKCRIVIFSANNDRVVAPEWVLQFARYQESIVYFLNDDHRFSGYLDQLPSLINLFL